MINRYKVPMINGDIARYSMKLLGAGCILLFVVAAFDDFPRFRRWSSCPS